MEVVSALKAVAPYAGVGGLGLVVFYYLFRDFVNKKIFPQLPVAKAYQLLRLFLVLTFTIAVLALLVGVVFHQVNRQADARDFELKQQADLKQRELLKQVEDEKRRHEERTAWEKEQRDQLAALNQQREELEESIRLARDSLHSQQTADAERQRNLLLGVEERRQALVEEDRRAIEAERQAIEATERKEAAERRKEERAARERVARYCCQPDGETRVCRLMSNSGLEVGDVCGCSNLWGTGVACR